VLISMWVVANGLAFQLSQFNRVESVRDLSIWLEYVSQKKSGLFLPRFFVCWHQMFVFFKLTAKRYRAIGRLMLSMSLSRFGQ